MRSRDGKVMCTRCLWWVPIVLRGAKEEMYPPEVMDQGKAECLHSDGVERGPVLFLD